jgi:hypothetical protein
MTVTTNASQIGKCKYLSKEEVFPFDRALPTVDRVASSIDRTPILQQASPTPKLATLAKRNSGQRHHPTHTHTPPMRHHRLLVALARRPPAAASHRLAVCGCAESAAPPMLPQRFGRAYVAMGAPHPSSSSSSVAAGAPRRRLLQSSTISSSTVRPLSSEAVAKLDDVIVTNACVKVRFLGCGVIRVPGSFGGRGRHPQP